MRFIEFRAWWSECTYDLWTEIIQWRHGGHKIETMTAKTKASGLGQKMQFELVKLNWINWRKREIERKERNVSISWFVSQGKREKNDWNKTRALVFKRRNTETKIIKLSETPKWYFICLIILKWFWILN